MTYLVIGSIILCGITAAAWVFPKCMIWFFNQYPESFAPDPELSSTPSASSSTLEFEPLSPVVTSARIVVSRGDSSGSAKIGKAIKLGPRDKYSKKEQTTIKVHPQEKPIS